MQREFSQPKLMTLGTYVQLPYTAEREYRGIKWYLTDFGHVGDREDWVADLPGAGVNVSRYKDQKGWGVASERSETWEQHADQELAMHLQYVVRAIKETEAKLAGLRVSRDRIEQALGVK